MKQILTFYIFITYYIIILYIWNIYHLFDVILFKYLSFSLFLSLSLSLSLITHPPRLPIVKQKSAKKNILHFEVCREVLCVLKLRHGRKGGGGYKGKSQKFQHIILFIKKNLLFIENNTDVFLFLTFLNIFFWKNNNQINNKWQRSAYCGNFGGF